MQSNTYMTPFSQRLNEDDNTRIQLQLTSSTQSIRNKLNRKEPELQTVLKYLRDTNSALPIEQNHLLLDDFLQYNNMTYEELTQYISTTYTPINTTDTQLPLLLTIQDYPTWINKLLTWMNQYCKPLTNITQKAIWNRDTFMETYKTKKEKANADPTNIPSNTNFKEAIKALLTQIQKYNQWLNDFTIILHNSIQSLDNIQLRAELLLEQDPIIIFYTIREKGLHNFIIIQQKYIQQINTLKFLTEYKQQKLSPNESQLQYWTKMTSIIRNLQDIGISLTNQEITSNFKIHYSQISISDMDRNIYNKITNNEYTYADFDREMSQLNSIQHQNSTSTTPTRTRTNITSNKTKITQQPTKTNNHLGAANYTQQQNTDSRGRRDSSRDRHTDRHKDRLTNSLRDRNSDYRNNNQYDRYDDRRRGRSRSPHDRYPYQPSSESHRDRSRSTGRTQQSKGNQKQQLQLSTNMFTFQNSPEFGKWKLLETCAVCTLHQHTNRQCYRQYHVRNNYQNNNIQELINHLTQATKPSNRNTHNSGRNPRPKTPPRSQTQQQQSQTQNPTPTAANTQTLPPTNTQLTTSNPQTTTHPTDPGCGNIRFTCPMDDNTTNTHTDYTALISTRHELQKQWGNPADGYGFLAYVPPPPLEPNSQTSTEETQQDYLSPNLITLPNANDVFPAQEIHTINVGHIIPGHEPITPSTIVLHHELFILYEQQKAAIEAIAKTTKTRMYKDWHAAHPKPAFQEPPDVSLSVDDYRRENRNYNRSMNKRLRKECEEAVTPAVEADLHLSMHNLNTEYKLIFDAHCILYGFEPYHYVQALHQINTITHTENPLRKTYHNIINYRKTLSLTLSTQEANIKANRFPVEIVAKEKEQLFTPEVNTHNNNNIHNSTNTTLHSITTGYTAINMINHHESEGSSSSSNSSSSSYSSSSTPNNTIHINNNDTLITNFNNIQLHNQCNYQQLTTIPNNNRYQINTSNHNPLNTIMDCGATHHILQNIKEAITQVKPCHGKVNLADDKSNLEITGRGNIGPLLVDGLICPLVANNLISLGALAQNFNTQTVINKTHCAIYNQHGELLIIAEYVDNLYRCNILEFLQIPSHLLQNTNNTPDTINDIHNTTINNNIAVNFAVNSHQTYHKNNNINTEIDLLHKRFGHAYPLNLINGIKKGVLRGYKLSKTTLKDNITNLNPLNKTICECCMKAKSHRNSFKSKTTTTTNRVGGLIVTDIQGPYSIPTINNEKYVITYTDYHSRYSWTYLLKAKNDALTTLKHLNEVVFHALNQNIKHYHSDNAGELIGSETTTYLEKNGITFTASEAYTPARNGIAERKFRTLSETTAAMLFDSGVPKTLWGYAYLAATYIRNRTPTTYADNMSTPYEKLHGKPPNVRHLRRWGCKAYPHTPKQLRTKEWIEKCEVGYLVNYSNTESYIIYIPERKKCTAPTIQVIFDENIPPHQETYFNELTKYEVKENKDDTPQTVNTYKHLLNKQYIDEDDNMPYILTRIGTQQGYIVGWRTPILTNNKPSTKEDKTPYHIKEVERMINTQKKESIILFKDTVAPVCHPDVTTSKDIHSPISTDHLTPDSVTETILPPKNTNKRVTFSKELTTNNTVPNTNRQNPKRNVKHKLHNAAEVGNVNWNIIDTNSLVIIINAKAIYKNRVLNE